MTFSVPGYREATLARKYTTFEFVPHVNCTYHYTYGHLPLVKFFPLATMEFKTKDVPKPTTHHCCIFLSLIFLSSFLQYYNNLFKPWYSTFFFPEKVQDWPWKNRFNSPPFRFGGSSDISLIVELLTFFFLKQCAVWLLLCPTDLKLFLVSWYIRYIYYIHAYQLWIYSSLLFVL